MREVEVFRGAVDDLSTLAVAETSTVLSEVARFDPAVQRDTLIEVMPVLVGPLASAAMDLAREWFEDSAPTSLALPPRNPLPSSESFAGLVFWALEPLFFPDKFDDVSSDLILSRLTGRAQKTIADAARGQTMSDVRATPGTTWVRVNAPGCCAWCVWIASLGNKYRTESAAVSVQGRGVDASVTAGKRGEQGKGVKSRSGRAIASEYHDWCRCSSVAVFKGDTFHLDAKNDALDIVKSITEDRPGNEGDTSTKALLSNMRYDLGLK